MTPLTQDQILALPGAKNHEKIFLLNQLGLDNKTIANLVCGGNGGRVYNDLKGYKENPDKIAAVNKKYLGE